MAMFLDWAARKISRRLKQNLDNSDYKYCLESTLLVTSLLSVFHASKVATLTQFKAITLSHISICAFCIATGHKYWHSSISWLSSIRLPLKFECYY